MRSRTDLSTVAPFQSTRPARGATLLNMYQQTIVIVSIHAPRAGRDRGGGTPVLSYGGVSIHAPRAGRDRRASTFVLSPARFNPRAPRGARLEQTWLLLAGNEFQSTRPARGATSKSRRTSRRGTGFNPRAPRGARPARATRRCRVGFGFNPRAPRGARQARMAGASCFSRCFNPRAPRGARPHGEGGADDPARVSIHAPRAGRDHDPLADESGGHAVSIHAPRAGRDVVYRPVGVTKESFNPRAPRGARPASSGCSLVHIRFQSTRPARGATSRHIPHQRGWQRFNPRAPRGARPSFCKSFCGVMQSNTQRERCYLCNCQRANPAPWSHNSCSTRWLPSARTSRGFDERLGFAHIKK